LCLWLHLLKLRLRGQTPGAAEHSTALPQTPVIIDCWQHAFPVL